MITYLKMKHAEWKVKKVFFETVLAVIDSQKDILAQLQKMYNEIIHEENENQND